MSRFGLVLAGVVTTAFGTSSPSLAGGVFRWTQLRHAGAWDPHPEFWDWASVFLERTTRIDPDPERRVLALEDPALFEAPFLLVTGRGDPRWTDRDLSRWRDYLGAGGFAFFDDSEAAGGSAFARAVGDLPGRLFPGARWRPVPPDHALHRAFFLISSAEGRRRVNPAAQGVWLGDRLVMVSVANDLGGALVRDALGQPLYSCEPGGENQRAAAAKFFVNLVVFSVTGTYKTDAVHQPFLERKGRP